MSTPTTALTTWAPNEPVRIPPSAAPHEIAQCARQLAPRDVKAIAQAFQAGSFEMVSTFIWVKAIAALKRQIATLGMAFIGEMLGRPDLDHDSDPLTSVGDHEALSLAEDLGMINTTEAMRLKHALVLVSHFAILDQKEGVDDEMMPEEALGILRTCVGSILGTEKIEPPLEFARFRRALETATLRADGDEAQKLAGGPYFFVRTTLSVLLSLLKTAEGAQLEHAAGNANALLPVVWERLRDPDRWQTGQAYAAIVADGNRIAAAGLKNALLAVKGFDYVPENLRSDTFTAAAAHVQNAHFASGNFYKEAQPMRVLANLGTTIPKPAFGACMTATLCVRLGNRWGDCWAAQVPAAQVLGSLRQEQWAYYVNQCLKGDKTILDKLADDERPLLRWIRLTGEFGLDKMLTINSRIAKLLTRDETKVTQVRSAARELRLRAQIET